MLIIYIPFFIIAIMMIAQSVHIPAKVQVSNEHIANYDPAIQITDNIGVLSETDKQQMYGIFAKIRDKTGVIPSFISISNSDWDQNTTLEQEAYDLYVNNFPDECHILVVYSTDPEASSSYDDWHFEIMVGDNAGNGSKGIFTGDTVSDLRSDLQKYFTARTRYTIGQAVTAAFSNRLPSLMSTRINWDGILFGAFILLFISVYAFL